MYLLEKVPRDEADCRIPKGERVKRVKVAQHGNRERANWPIRNRDSRLSGISIGSTLLITQATGQWEDVLSGRAPHDCLLLSLRDSDLFPFSRHDLAVAK
jgi:hypothetical protein